MDGAPLTAPPESPKAQNKLLSGFDASPASISTDSFADSPVIESKQILDVYSLLERNGGVYGDGWHQGVELTRDGRALSCSQSLESKRSWEKRLFLAQHGDPSADLVGADYEIDRYGFFVGSQLEDSNPAERAILLSSQAYSDQRVDLPVASTSCLPPKATLGAARMQSRAELDKENDRTEKWLEMLVPPAVTSDGAEWRLRADVLQTTTGKKKLRRRIYKGIPDRWRPAVWPVLAALSPDFEQVPSSLQSLKSDLGRGLRLRNSVFLPANSFDTQIDLDIPRTLSSHTLFVTRYGKGQRMLFEVLHERSAACPACGYCQGMANVASICIAYGAGSLVDILHGRCPGERRPKNAANGNLANGHAKEVDTTLQSIGKFRMHDMYRQDFPALKRCFDQQDRLCAKWMPKVSEILVWYITIYSSSVFTFPMQLRIWDAFLCEGTDLLVVIALAILWALRAYICHPKADFESILNSLSSAFVVQDQDLFMRWCYKRLKIWRKRPDLTQSREPVVETSEI